MRDANSRNLSLEADQLVTSKFIHRVLSLHLPRFEVAPFHLWLAVRDRVFAPSSGQQRPGTRVSFVGVSSVVCSRQTVFLRVHQRLEERKLGERERERAPVYASFGGFKVVLSCFANQQSSSSQSKRCLIQH